MWTAQSFSVKSVCHGDTKWQKACRTAQWSLNHCLFSFLDIVCSLLCPKKYCFSFIICSFFLAWILWTEITGLERSRGCVGILIQLYNNSPVNLLIYLKIWLSIKKYMNVYSCFIHSCKIRNNSDLSFSNYEFKTYSKTIQQTGI